MRLDRAAATGALHTEGGVSIVGMGTGQFNANATGIDIELFGDNSG